MAGESVVGALRIVLGMDTSGVDEGTKDAVKKLESFGKDVFAIFTGVGLEHVVEKTFETIAEAIRGATIEAVKFADEMGKTAQKVGLSVEQITGLQVAATLSDVSMESLAISLGRLSKNLVTAAEGNRQLRDEFKQAGVSIRDADGNITSVLDALNQLADHFQGTQDGAVKTATALTLLGRAGKDLIPLLNEGSGNLAELTKTAQNMGLVISQDTAKKAQDFNDNLKIMNLAIQGVANLVVKDLIDGFVKLSNQFADTAKKGNLIQTTAQNISNSFKEVVLSAVIAQSAFSIITAAWDDFNDTKKHPDKLLVDVPKHAATALGWFKSVVDSLNEWAGVNEQVAKTGQAIPEAVAPLAEEFGGVAQKSAEAGSSVTVFQTVVAAVVKAIADARAQMGDFWKPITEGGHGAAKAIQEVKDKKLSDELDKLSLQARTLSGDFTLLPKGFAEMAAQMGLTDKAAASLYTNFSNLSVAQQQLALAMAKVEGLMIAQEMMTPAAQYDLMSQHLQALIPLLDQLGVSSDAVRLKIIKGAADMAVSYGNLAQSIVGPLASAFKDLASMNKQYAGAAKAFAIAEALVNTYLGATKAFTATVQFGLPFAIAAAAAATVAGLANVAKISATQFAKGGSFTVPGGLSGVDTKMVPLSLAAGERVDVTPASQVQAYQSGGGVQEIALTGISGRDLFTGDMLRDLFDGLNKGMSNGYKLKVA